MFPLFCKKDKLSGLEMFAKHKERKRDSAMKTEGEPAITLIKVRRASNYSCMFFEQLTAGWIYRYASATL